MDMVVLDIVAAEVAYRFDGVRFSTDLNFVAFHGFLDGGADVTDAYVDSCILKHT